MNRHIIRPDDLPVQGERPLTAFNFLSIALDARRITCAPELPTCDPKSGMFRNLRSAE